MVHGSGGSYRQAPQSGLGPRPAAKDYASLAIDTRRHDDKINTDNFLSVPTPSVDSVRPARQLSKGKLPDFPEWLDLSAFEGRATVGGGVLQGMNDPKATSLR